ncbi:sugar porter family MFS transporter [Asticcacaulis solisilvae]|uniref:sugar porter family MFS transporter n=1 Tax=Asticcacaulis solisilvae TaxID=1217274 RepID=UPI003FD87FF3
MPSDAIRTAATAAPRINLGYIVLVAVAAALGGLMFGFDVAIITGAGPFIEARFGLDALGLGVAFSALLFGCGLGAAASGLLVDRIGRKALMIAVAVAFGVTTVLTGLAPGFAAFVAARFLGGLAVGAVSLVAPMYVSEITPARLRGRMGALYQMAIVTGILVSYLINYALRDFGPDAWRYMFFTGAVPALLYLLLVMTVPESPRFLVQKGRDTEAAFILDRIGGADGASAVTEIRASLAQGKGSWLDLFHRDVRAPLAIGFVLAILIHLSGINTVIDYAPTIFKSAGFTLDAALFSTFIVGGANFVFTLLSFWIIDRVGRRGLYIWGSLGMAAALLGLVAAVLTGHFYGVTVLGLIVLYLLFFAACIGPVFWTLLPEIFPNGVRGRAMTVPVLTQWVANAVVVLLFPGVFHAVGQAATFGLLAAACLAQAVFALVFVPETRNRSLEEIAARWAGPRQ